MHIPRGSSLHYLKPSDRQLLEELGIRAEEEFDLGEEEGYVLCGTCGNAITTLDSIIAVNGKHKHTFTNPSGIIYEIGCFAAAEGCAIHGIPTFVFTWFPGFSWNLAFCSNCSSHLGWHYRTGDARFFGLILERLAENIRTH